MILADINDYLDGLNYNLNAEEKQLMDIYAECWEHCHKGDCHNCEYRSGNEWCKMLMCMSYQYAKRLIAAGYSKPVVHAHWEMKPVDTTPGTYHLKKAFCSNCGKPNKQYRPPYCPHCGAKMDEREVRSDGQGNV